MGYLCKTVEPLLLSWIKRWIHIAYSHGMSGTEVLQPEDVPDQSIGPLWDIFSESLVTIPDVLALCENLLGHRKRLSYLRFSCHSMIPHILPALSAVGT